MGLLTSEYQGESERLQRQSGALVRAHNHDARAIKAEAAPYQVIIDYYNQNIAGTPIPEAIPGEISPQTLEYDKAKAAKGELDRLSARSAALQGTTEHRGLLIGARANRLATNVAMDAPRLAREIAPPQAQSNSVFDQNMATIHQTIADWLR